MGVLANLGCESANLFGWQVGGATSALGNVLLLLRILLSPALGPSRVPGDDRFSRWRRALRHLLWFVPIGWLGGGLWPGGAFALCYARGVAISSIILFGMLLLITIVTGANQIGNWCAMILRLT